jgi:dienelactone hydrolase
LTNSESDLETKLHVDNFLKPLFGPKAAGVSYRFINYPGAKHAFTNPDADSFGKEFGLPLAYNSDADTQSWRAMQEFFDEVFK